MQGARSMDQARNKMDTVELKSEIKVLQDSISDIDLEVDVESIIEQLLDIVSQIEVLGTNNNDL